MKYVKIRWEHPWKDTPCEIYSEIGDNNLEQRKIERFKNGKIAYAHDNYSDIDIEAGTFLSYEEYPSLESINSPHDSREKVVAVYITKEEFEKNWFRYVTGNK